MGLGRRALGDLVVLAMCSLLSLPGCSTSSSVPAAPAPTCGAGAQLHGGFCVVTEAVPEAGAATGGVTLSRDVQQIFTRYCGVVGCHVPGSLAGQLNLAPGFAYGALVNQVPSEIQINPADGLPLFYVKPGDLQHSYLFIKVHVDQFDAFTDAAVAANISTRALGSEMPASGTNSALDPNTDLRTIDDWIDGGALP